MKKIYSLICFVGLFSLAKAQFPAPYCPEAYASNAEPITNVEFGTIANTSSDVTGGTEHEDYTAISTDVTQGAAYTIKVQGNTDGSYSDYVTVFFDWNQDGDFDDAGERYNIGIITNSTGLDSIAVVASILVPIDATLGSTRMRVSKKWNAYQNPCNTAGYGESEDYTVNVLASPSCTGTPVIATASGPASSCSDSMITVTVSGITAATGITYQWQSSNIGANTWTNVAGATTATATFQHVAGGKDYRCVLTCTASSLSANSTVITVQSYSCTPPVNDDPCDAITLVLNGPSDCQNTKYATSVNDPSSFTCSTPNNTTWYKYTPAANGAVEFVFRSTDSLRLNGWVGVYEVSGSCPGGLSFTDVTTAAGGCKSFGTDTLTKFTLNLTGGTEYYFMIDGVSGAVGTYCVSIQAPPPPPVNDDPCDAISLVLDGPSDCQDTKYATSINDPSAFTCSTPNNTTWYKYTPASSGLVQFTFKTPATGALNGWLGVYTTSGSCPGVLTFTDVTTASGGCKSFGSDTVTVFTMNLTGGTEYYFMVDGVGGAIGSYCISIQTPPPAPATCATNVSPLAGAIDVSAPDAVIKWTPVSGATSYDVYFGTTNPPTTVRGTSTTDSFIVTGLAFSTQYYWYALPKNSGGSPTGCDANTTDFTTIAPPPPPNNDDCDSAINVVAGATVSGSTISATQTMTAQTCSGFTGTADDDVWFKFTANQSGNVDIKLVPVGTSFDAVVIAYSGDCSTLTQIGCADTSYAGGTEIVHLTGLNAGETYYFRVYSYGSTTAGQGTFGISIEGSALLPVTITQFIGERKGSVNVLSWTTATESNNKGFELQRSYNGTSFLPLNFVATKAHNGNSTTQINYAFEDSKPFAGTTYYRLKQVDYNGKTTLSNVVAIKGDKVTNLTITDVYPNPATQMLNIIISAPANDKVALIITDVTGKVVKTQNVVVAAGNTNTKVEVANLAQGTYLMKVVCNNGCNSATTKFVKQ